MKATIARTSRNTQQRTGRHSGNNQERQKHVSAAENRFGRAMFRLRALRSTVRTTKEEEVNIAHIINKVQTYGFGFFPNHYVMDDIIELEGIIKDIGKRTVVAG